MFTIPMSCNTIMFMSNTITIRLPEDLLKWLESESETTGQPKGRIIRAELERARTQKRRQPFLDLAGTHEGPADLSLKRGFEK